MSRGDLTFQQADALLRYEPETGRLFWKVSRPNRPAGSEAGSLNNQGRRVLTIENQKHQATRVAFLLMTGRHPGEMVDHKNGDRADDRWENLREATRAQNSANRRCTSKKTHLKGAYPWPTGGRWFATITIDRKVNHLGSFDTAEEAHAAYRVAATAAFGEYARFE